MSGKSTFLRALGLNVVLAQTGAPVRASRLVLSPLAVGASIRVLDSLLDGKSRFYAEITRLKQVVDLVVAANGHVLFLLDEILSGTNSHDRRLGAQALLTELVARHAVGLVTTHDLALGEIADRPRLARRQRPLRRPLPGRNDDLRLPPAPRRRPNQQRRRAHAVGGASRLRAGNDTGHTETARRTREIRKVFDSEAP